MSITIKGFVRTTAASLTMATTVLSLAGFAALTPATALAVAPADFGLTEGDVIRATGDVDLYIVNQMGYKRLFVNPAIFNLYGHIGWAKVKEVTPAARDAFQTSGLFRVDGDTKVYGLDVVSEDVANLRWVNTSGAQAVADDANFFAKVFTINAAEKALYGVGADYTSVTQVPNYARGGSTVTPVAGFNPNGGTQGSLRDETLGSPAKDTVLEGQSKVEVYAVDMQTENDGPVMLQSADVWVANTSGGVGASLKPWDIFTKVTLTLDGKEIGSMSANSSSDWSDKFTTCNHVTSCDTQEYRMRFTNLNGVLANDKTQTLAIEFSVVGSMDSSDKGETWGVNLGDHRILDESGFVTTVAGDEYNNLESDFTVDASKIAEVDAAEASSPIKAGVVAVSDTSDTNGIAIYSFTLEEKNGVAMDVTDLSATFTTTVQTNESNVIRRAMVYEGSTLKGTETVADGGAVTFQNVNLHLNADQKKTYTIKVDVKDTNDQVRFTDGTTVAVSVTGLPTLADANGNDETDIVVNGLALTSPQQQLRVDGVNVELTSVGFAKTYSRDAATTGDADQATATYKFKVTAFGSDAYIDEDGADHTVTESQGTADAIAKSITSTDATHVTNGFRVDKGTTKNFTLTVVVTAGSNEFYQEKVGNIKYAKTDINGNLNFNFAGVLDDFLTDPLWLTVTP